MCVVKRNVIFGTAHAAKATSTTFFFISIAAFFKLAYLKFIYLKFLTASLDQCWALADALSIGAFSFIILYSSLCHEPFSEGAFSYGCVIQ